MKRIDFSLTRGQVLTLKDDKLTVKRSNRYAIVVLCATAALVLALFASAASGDELAGCDKQKYGKSGRCYEWKKDC